MAPPKKRDEPQLTNLEKVPVRLDPIVTSFRTPDGLVLLRKDASVPFCSVTFEPGPPPDVISPALVPPPSAAAPAGAAPSVTPLWQERLKTLAKDMGLSETEYLEQLLRRAWVSRPIDKKAS